MVTPCFKMQWEKKGGREGEKEHFLRNKVGILNIIRFWINDFILNNAVKQVSIPSHATADDA